MDMTIDQQVALDEALVPHASRIRIRKSNFHLRSDITSKESTLQLVYDVLRLTPFRKAFFVTVDTFDELPSKEEILAFLRYLGHSGEIRKLTNVNINKLHEPWRSFTAVLNKCLSRKSTGYDSLRNKANWHYVIDDQMFTMIKLVSRHQNTQQFGVMLPVELTNEDIRNSEAYKEYYAITSGAAPPKTKASVRKTKSSFDTTITPLTVAGTRLLTSAKGKQPAKSSKAKGLSVLSEFAMTKAEQIKLATKQSPCNKLISTKLVDLKSSDEDDNDEVDDRSDDQEDDDDQDDDDQDDNDDDQNTDNDGDDFVHPKLSIHEEEAKDEESFDPTDVEDDDEELYRDVNINLEGIDSLFETTPWVDVQTSTTVAPLTLTAPTLPPPTIPTISQVPQVPTPPTTAPSTFLHDLLNFGSLFGFDHRLKTLEANFSEFMQTNQFARAVSYILRIVKRYMDQRINEAVKIIKEQVKEQVKVQVSKILPKIGKTVNEQLEAEVLTRSSNSSKTSSDIAIKNPPLDQTGGPRGEEKEKSQSQQALKRRRQPRPLARLLKGPNLIKRLQASTTNDQPIAEASQHPEWFQQQKKPPTPNRAWNKTLPATHGNIQPWISDLAKQVDSHSSFNELMDTPMDFLAFLINRLKVDTLTPELLVGDFKRLRIQDTKDMLLLLVQGKLTNLTVEERFAFNDSLRMFTRSIVIVKDLQLGVESYQKKLNLTKPDTYRSDLKRKEAYNAYSNPRGFIYQNKDKQNRLMQIEELHKFSDGTLNDVRTALDDRLKGIRMKYLP
uniref:Uncharacterized protein n=1 Tax=Tanacetum cinerariifolium TaxID=118510 RepID=A0A699HZ47_TANCI|nr:hypothetical protein [Tanacetum cinerariifolium]